MSLGSTQTATVRYHILYILFAGRPVQLNTILASLGSTQTATVRYHICYILFAGRPVQLNTILASLGSTQSTTVRYHILFISYITIILFHQCPVLLLYPQEPQISCRNSVLFLKLSIV